MVNKVEKQYGNVTVIQRSDYQWGIIDSNGNEVVPFGKYAWIDGFEKGLARVRSHGKITYSKNIVAIIGLDEDPIIEGQEEIQKVIQREFEEHPESFSKWGIINELGEEVLPVVYDEVWNFLGKGRFSTKAVKAGVEHDIRFDELNPVLKPKRVISVCDDDNDDYGTHYGEYAGTYAQDVAGYSDDVINDAFDGDPDAYWNID